MKPEQEADLVKKALLAHVEPGRAKASAWFFKTGPGQYGEGDQFIGVRVPKQHLVAKSHGNISLPATALLLASPIHEHRLTGALILVRQYERAEDEAIRSSIATFYLAHLDRINNWDIVDSSAPQIVGGHLFPKKDRLSTLRRMATSKNLWERRVAVLATQYFIREGEFDDTLALAELLLSDTHDLMHKAVGWMLREVGKKDEKVLRQFLDKHASVMPRTMLRYAIEKFSKADRQHYLAAK